MHVGFDWGYDTTENFHFLEGLWDFLDDTRSRATLFVVGNVAERLAQSGISKRVEVASLGMSGEAVAELDEDKLLEELKSSKAMLESMFHGKVKGFRAPGFRPNLKQWELLKLLGYEYSSSTLPSVIPRRHGVPREPFRFQGIVELPASGLFLPFGLTLLRFFPPAKLLSARTFVYSTTELIAKAPNTSLPRRLLAGFRRGKPARKVLYDYLYGHAPTSSVEQYLRERESFPEREPTFNNNSFNFPSVPTKWKTSLSGALSGFRRFLRRG